MPDIGLPVDVTIVIACYNEAPHLARNVRRIADIMNQTNYSYEVLFIDDCSQDGTRAEIEKICNGQPNYRYVFHATNVGRGGTVTEGLLAARGRYAGFLDIDLEVDARYIPSIILELEQGSDVVSVDRIYTVSLHPVSLLRVLMSKVNKHIVRSMLNIKAPDSEAGYKFFNLATTRDILTAAEDKKWFWDSEIMVRAERAGKKITFIPGAFVRHPEKKSTVRLIPDTIAHIKALRACKKKLSL